jgi:hypothetical protein
MYKMIKKAIHTTLNAETYTEIKTDTQDLYGFGMFAHNSGTGTMAQFYVAWSSDGDNATLIPAIGGDYGDFQSKGSTICWAKAVSGTPILTVLPAIYTSYK